MMLRILAVRTWTIITIILCGAPTLIAGPVAGGPWFDDEGNHRFNPREDSWTSNGGGGRIEWALDGGGSTCWVSENKKGVWWAANYSYPDTIGTLRLKLKYLKLNMRCGKEDTTPPKKNTFAIEVSVDEDIRTAQWKQVKVVTDAFRDKARILRFPQEPEFKWIRIVNHGPEKVLLFNVEVFGCVVEDAKAAAFVPAPSIMLDAAHLARLKEAVTQGTHPAGITLDDLRQYFPPTKYTPQKNTGQIIEDQDHTFSRDMCNAYAFALMYNFTGNAIYAENSQAILREWKNTNYQKDGAMPNKVSDKTLPAHIAMDILLGTWPSFEKNLIDAWFSNYRENRYLASCEERLSQYQLNMGQSVIRFLLLAAVQTKNRYRFNQAIWYWKKNIQRNFIPVGQNSEMCRDFQHGESGYRHMIVAAEIAHNQGYDALYEYSAGSEWNDTHDRDFLGYRLANMLEYHAQTMSRGNEVIPPPVGFAKKHPQFTGKIMSFDRVYKGDGGRGPNMVGAEYALKYYIEEKGIAFHYARERLDYQRTNRIYFANHLDEEHKKWSVNGLGGVCFDTLTHATKMIETQR